MGKSVQEINETQEKLKVRMGLKKKKEIIDWTYINIKDIERNKHYNYDIKSEYRIFWYNSLMF